MLQFDLQFYEELTVAWVRTVKFISGAFFWPTGQLVFMLVYVVLLWYKRERSYFQNDSWSDLQRLEAVHGDEPETV